MSFRIPYALFVLMLSQVAAAADPPPPAEKELRFRSEYVPEEDLDELARGMPMKHADFSRLLLEASASNKSQHTSKPRIGAAVYTARFNGSALVEGTASLAIEYTRQAASLLAIEPLNLAIEQPAWLGEARKPLIGLTSSSSAGVLVERSGTLQWKWSLQGKQASEEVVVALELPPALSNQLELQLPHPWRAAADVGMATELPAPNGEPPAAGPARNTFWRIDLGGRNKVRLRFFRPDASLVSDTSYSYDQRYRISEQGLHFSSDIEIEHEGEEMTELPFQWNNELQIVSITLDGAPASYHISQGERGEASLHVDLSPSNHALRQIHIEALGPLVLGATWRLPGLQFENAQWRAGKTAVEVETPLRCTRLQPNLGRQTAAIPLAEPRTGTSFLLTAEAAEASIDIELQQQAAFLTGTCVSALRVEGGQIQAEVRTLLRTETGRQFRIAPRLAPQWIIDGVTAEPSAALESWRVLPRQKQAELQCTLAEPVTPDQPVRLTIRAHRQRPGGGEAVSFASGRVFTFSDSVEQFLALRQGTSGRLQPGPDSAALALLDASRLASLKTLLPSDSQMVLDVSRQATGNLIFIGRENRFAAELSVSAVAGAERLRESYRLVIRPNSSGPASLLVHFSQTRQAEMNWEPLTGGNMLRAKRLSQAQQQLVGIAGGETWQLEFAKPQTEEITVLGERSTPLASGLSVSFVSIPEADSQTGLLTLAVEGNVAVDTSGLLALPVRSPPPLQTDTVRARYRYNPAQDAGLFLRPLEEKNSTPKLWAWSLQYDYDLSKENRALHTAAWQLENAGAKSFHVQLPPGASLIECKIDGKEFQPASRSGELIISLLPQNRFPTVRIVYSLPGPGLGWRQEVTPQPPTCSAVVLEQQANIWSPPGYEFVDSSNEPAQANWLGATPAALVFLFDWKSSKNFPSAKVSRCEEQLDELAKSVASSRGVWEDLLTQYQNVSLDSARSLPILRLDEHALIGANVRPYSELPAPTENWLSRAGLALAEVGSEVVLTSPGKAAQLRAQNNNKYVADMSAGTSFNSIERWLRNPALAQSPWIGEELLEATQLRQHWNIRAITLNGGPSPVVVVHTAFFRSLSWCLLLLIAAITWMSARRFALRLILIAGLFGSAAVWLPTSWAALALSIPLGVLSGFVAFALWGRQSSAGRPATESGGGSTAISPAASVVATLLLFAAIAIPHADAQEPTQETDEIVRVIIPIDKEKQPTGDYLYLPRSFYDELHRRATGNRGTPQGWLLTNAFYRCHISHSAEEEPSLAEVEATVGVHTLEANQGVQLPFRRQDIQLLTSVLLDGQETEIEWNSAGDQFTVAIDVAGDHSLQLRWRMAEEKLPGAVGFRFLVPPIPSAKGEVIAVSGENYEMSSLAGLPSVVEGVRLLGPVKEVLIRKPIGQKAEAVELQRLHLTADSITSQVRLRLNSPTEPLRLFEATFGSPWELEPVQSKLLAGPATVESWQTRQRLLCEFKPEAGEQAELVLNFKLRGGNGIGQIPPLAFETGSATITQRFTALFVAEDLQSSVQSSGQAVTIPVSEFLAAWGSVAKNTPLPQAAWKVPADDTSPLRVETRYKTPVTMGTARLDLSVGAKSAKLHYQAELITEAGFLLQHRLSIPQSVKATEVRFHAEEGNKILHWSRNEAGLVIFFTQPVAGAYRIEVLGEMPVGSTMKAPQLQFETAALQPAEVQIFRQPEIALALDQSWQEPVSPLFREGWGRLVAVAESGPSLELNTSENKPISEGRMFTSLNRQGDAWFADLFLIVETTGGMLDAVRLAAPLSLGAPIALEPEGMTATAVPLPGGDQQEIILRPLLPIEGKQVLRFRCPIVSSPEQRLQAPDLRVLGSGSFDRFLIVPRELESQQIAWETRGLREVPLPNDYPTSLLKSLTFAAYQVVGPRFQAAIRRIESASGVPQIRLADICYGVSEGGEAYGTVSFDLDPAGLTRCRLRMPPGLSPVHLRVAETSALYQSLGGTDWEIVLGPEQLPQHIDVIFAGKLEGSALSAPILLGNQGEQLPVERTLWCVSAPPAFHLPENHRTTETRQQQLRWKTKTAMIELASVAVAEIAPRDVARWYLPWARRQIHAQAGILHSALQRQSANTANMEAQQQQAALALGAQESREQALAEAESFVTLGDCSRFSQGELVEPRYYAFQGSQYELPLVKNHSLFRYLLPLLGILAWLLTAIGLAWLWRNSNAADWLVQWPHFFLSLPGIGWALFLEPSWIGWIWAGLAVVGALRGSWKAVRDQHPLASGS